MTDAALASDAEAPFASTGAPRTATLTVPLRDGFAEVQGEMFGPVLAVIPAIGPEVFDPETGAHSYCEVEAWRVLHTPTGMAIGGYFVDRFSASEAACALGALQGVADLTPDTALGWSARHARALDLILAGAICAEFAACLPRRPDGVRPWRRLGGKEGRA